MGHVARHERKHGAAVVGNATSVEGGLPGMGRVAVLLSRLDQDLLVRQDGYVLGGYPRMRMRMDPDRSASERERPGISVKGAAAVFVTAEDVLAFRATLLRWMSTRLDEATAEDVVQEIFLQAYRDFGRYDSRRASLSTWLFRLADQALAMHLRSRARRLRAEQESVAQEDRLPGLDPAEREEVRRLLEQLGPLSHRIMAARYLLGLSTEEIAEELGLSPAAVRQRMSRCLTRLRTEAEGMTDSGHPDEFSTGCRTVSKTITPKTVFIGR